MALTHNAWRRRGNVKPAEGEEEEEEKEEEVTMFFYWWEGGGEGREPL